MIRSFQDPMTEALFHGDSTKARRFPSELRRAVQRKLQYINAAARLDDLKVPPGNRLEKLKGDLREFHSIRINEQWRIVFRWIENDAHQVKVMDYHD
jgi:toxin HigB-1